MRVGINNMNIFEIAKQDDYVRLAVNINQKIYRSKEINKKQRRNMSALLTLNAKKYFIGEVSPITFLTVLSSIEQLRCELLNKSYDNETMLNLRLLIKKEREFSR
jgi:hypothetical protein